MLARHEDELVCDMAEVYHIFDLRELPVRKLAVLACGLSSDSRVMMAMNGSKLSTTDTLLCLAVDKLSNLVWMQSKDGVHGRNKPKSVLEELTKEKPKSEYVAFASSEDFKAARRRIIGG